MSNIKVLIVDDHKIVRDGLRLYLDKIDNLEIIGESENGLDALEFIENNLPDVVLIDINMEVMDGIEATKQLQTKHPDLKVIALTMHNDYQHIKAMMDAGAQGYVLKNCDEAELRKAIETVMNGALFYSQEVGATVMSNMAKKKLRKESLAAPLTPREKEVYRLILDEKSNQEIADLLFISIRTVEVHKRNLLEKTGAKNSTGLVLYAIKNELFDDI